MRRSLMTILAAAVVAAFGLLTAAPAAAVSLKVGKGCRSSEQRPYVGIYQWRGSPGVQPVRFWFDRIEPDGPGRLKAIGRGIYTTPPAIRIALRATIDTESRRIEIWETNPSNPNFETRGSHVGTISVDNCSIRAVWTTRGSGAKGDLVLEIENK